MKAIGILKIIARPVPIIRTFRLMSGLNCDAAIPIITALSADNTRSIKIIWMVILISSEKNSVNWDVYIK